MSVAVNDQNVSAGCSRSRLKPCIKYSIQGVLVDVGSDDFEVSVRMKFTNELVFENLIEVIDFFLRIVVIQRQGLVVERNREVGVFTEGSF